MKKHLYFLSIVFCAIAFCTTFKGQDVTPPIVHLNVAILLDSGDELSDGKGAVFTDLTAAIRDKVPIIASSYLMKILIDNKDKEDHRPIKTLFAQLLDPNQWSLFKNTLSDFVVLLPNNFWPHLGKIDTEKLALIGLNKGVLTQITSDEFETMFKDRLPLPINMDSLEGIFLIDQNIRKRIYLTGHGYFDEKMQGYESRTSIAQLTVTEYRRFLDFLNTIGTDILYVDSCYSGGLNLLAPYLAKVGTVSEQLLNYFIIIGGLTDTETLVTYNSSNYKKFFEAINSFFSPQGPKTQNPLGSIAQHKWGNFSNNIPSVRFPGSLHYFKAIDVDGKTEIITQAKVTAQVLEKEKNLKQVPEIGEISAQIKEKQEKGEDVTVLAKELEKQLKTLAESKKDGKGSISIDKDKKVILLYPLMIPIDLTINRYENFDTISMIPGNAIHYIESITTKQFIDDFFLSFYGLGIASTKIFFIKFLTVSSYARDRSYTSGIKSQPGMYTVLLENVFIKHAYSPPRIIIFKIGNQYYEGGVSYGIEQETYKKNPAFIPIGTYLKAEQPIIFDQISEEEAHNTIIQEVKNLLFMPETIQFLGGKEHLEKQLNTIMKRIIPGWIATSLLK